MSRLCLVLALFVATGCTSGEEIRPGGSTGKGGSGPGGGGTTGTTTGAGGSATTGAGGAVTTTGAGGSNACGAPTAAQTCAGTVAPKLTLIDFSRYTATGTWGDSATGDLTGGTSPYHGTGADLTLAVQGSAPDTTLHITGSVAVNDYAGFVLWFGPCVNAAMAVTDTAAGTMAPTTGIRLQLGGSLGGSQMRFQVQSHADYPVDVANTKGGCLYNCDTSKWSQCVPPGTLMTTVPTAVSSMDLLWGVFAGGKPSTGTDGNGLVGLQFQFECGTSPSCNIDVSLGAITLLP